MFNTYMRYSAVLIALYLVVTHASGAGTVLTQGANGLATVDKTLQAR
jgi:hypothetical protein